MPSHKWQDCEDYLLCIFDKFFFDEQKSATEWRLFADAINRDNQDRLDVVPVTGGSCRLRLKRIEGRSAHRRVQTYNDWDEPVLRFKVKFGFPFKHGHDYLDFISSEALELILQHGQEPSQGQQGV